MFAKELMLRTCGANGKHQWCWGLNTLRYVAGMRVTCCQESVVLPKGKQYLFDLERFAFPTIR